MPKEYAEGPRGNKAIQLRLEDRMKRLLLAGLAVSGLFGGSAVAADLARVPVYAPPPPVVTYFTWTGCYVGGNVGGLWAKKDWIDQILSDPLFETDFGSHSARGVLGGLQAGCDYQVGGGVFGIQGDYDWTNASGNNANVFFPRLTNQSQSKSLASVTGRVGYAWDRFLGYVKAGGAWEQSNYSILVAGTAAATASETRRGWTVGIGGEYAFLNWLTGFVEYDYYDFGTNTNTFVCATCGLFAVTVPLNITTNISVVKVGLNFKFGG
jgi:outer membrane immunogenic protein